jgi:FAD/FMN-containing dehydrogenase
VPADATAFAHRDAEAMIVYGAFLPRDATDADADAALALWPAVARRGTGVYLNFQGSDTAADLVTAYPPRTYARLAEAKRRYDPENVFARHHNVPPGNGTPAEGLDQ